MTEVNARFAGSIPQTYHDHLGPLFFEPYAADLVARLGPDVGDDGRILEIAAGTGILTRHLHDRFHGRATIIATDLNQAMLDIGRERVGVGPALEWQQAEATALPFPPESFDAVVCQFGLMFFPDKAAAVREAYRVLRPGGRVLFNVWDSLQVNPLGRIAHETIGAFFTASPPDFFLVPFGSHDTTEMRSLFTGAGFSDIRIETVNLEGVSQSAEHAATGLVRGNPVLLAIEERGTATPDLIIAALTRALAKSYGDRPLRVPMRAHVISGRRPDSSRA